MNKDTLQKHVDSVQKQGYTLIEGVLSDNETEDLKNMLERDYDKYSPYYANSQKTSHALNNKNYEKVVYNMHNKDSAYLPYFEHKSFLPVVNKLLTDGSYNNAEPFHLLNISARCPTAGAPKQQLHLDSNLPGPAQYSLLIVAILILDDFNEKNGTTRFVPKTHLQPNYAEDGKSYDDEVCISAKAGSVLLFDGALWHGGTNKINNDTRWGIILGYGRWFIKPTFDFVRNTPASIYEKMTDSMKELLGFKTTPPLDEFTRVTRKSPQPCWSSDTYQLPE